MKWLLSAVFAALLMSSCTSYHPVTATSNPVGHKIGSASSVNILGFIRKGDASIKQAVRNGGIKNISTVDEKREFYLFFYRRTTIVSGN
jgi:hypothetical protein